MAAIRIRHGYSTVVSSGGGRERLPVLVGDTWTEPLFSGFTSDLMGALVAVSNVVFFSTDDYRWIEVNQLVLGCMQDEHYVKIILQNDLPILLPGEKYQPPSVTDTPRCNVVKLKRCSK
jgi:hypothetical protein